MAVKKKKSELKEAPKVTSAPRGMGKAHVIDEDVVKSEARAPKPKAKPEGKVKKFTGRGTLLVKWEDKGQTKKVVISFTSENNYIYRATEEAVISKLEELGYQEVE